MKAGSRNCWWKSSSGNDWVNRPMAHEQPARPSLLPLCRPVVFLIGHGDGGVCPEPFAHPALDAPREPASQGALWLPGEPGELFLDDPGGQHTVQPWRGEHWCDEVVWLAAWLAVVT